jgi:thiol:disulfide interchange protein DsbA
MSRRLLLLAIVLMAIPATLSAQMRWQEGRHFQPLPPIDHALAPAGKIAVIEVFSYACIHCFHAKDAMRKLRESLPADAVMIYMPAAFQTQQAWPMLQRAWYTAQALGIAEAMHDQLFASIWETGELPLLDKATGGIRNPLPTIADAARIYARNSPVKATQFQQLAASKKIDQEIRRADELIRMWRVPGTPAVVVNGRYLIDNSALSGWEDLQQLVAYLVGLERQRLQVTSAHAR